MADVQLITPRSHDITPGFAVRRALPSAVHQAVGPFLFFDHFGPVDIEPFQNIDVRPHPHIGLATVTYLFEGGLVHRDSTGVVQRIEPGAVNWMTAGRGIVHSERTPEELRSLRRRSHGLQLWCALPANQEESEPRFQHVESRAVPSLSLPGADVRVLVGSAFGAESPVHTLSPTLYLDIAMDAGASFTLPKLAVEMGLYSVDNELELDGVHVPARTIAVLPATSAEFLIRTSNTTRFVLIGGDPLGHRFIVWNFVASRKERIAQAQQDWAEQRFDRVPGETEFIPLPVSRSSGKLDR